MVHTIGFYAPLDETAPRATPDLNKNDPSFPSGSAGSDSRADADRPRRRPNRWHGRVEGSARRCEHPGCDEAGEFRAPPPPEEAGQSGDGPGRYRWFCLEHVRAFNQSYNFFAGMTPDEIYEAQRPGAGWERETRAFASAGSAPPPRWNDFSDPLDAIGARFRESLDERRRSAAARPPLSAETRDALTILGLGADADRTAIRRAYTALVRRYHPDRNGGDRRHEKALAKVIAAYTHLRGQPAFT